MIAYLKRNKKRFKLHAFYDGEKTLELYKSKDHTSWVGSYDIPSNITTYYISKCCPKEIKTNLYKLVIPKEKIFCDKFIGFKVDW